MQFPLGSPNVIGGNRRAASASARATQEQLLLLNFRAVARRLFGMHVALRHAQLMLTYDRGLPPLVQREWFAIHHREIVNAKEALANLTLLKSRYDEWVNASTLHEAQFRPPGFRQ